MLTLITALSSLLVCRFRSRAALELEVVALRHQLAVLRRRQPGRPKLTSMDRLLWVWLYGPASRSISATRRPCRRRDDAAVSASRKPRFGLWKDAATRVAPAVLALWHWSAMES
jgi:hypothetical protein